MFEAYAVNNAEDRKDRYFVGRFDTEQGARNRVREAIASGCAYGYVKQGHQIVCYLTEDSFAVRGLIEKAKAQRAGAHGGKRIGGAPLLRVEFG